MGDFQLPPALTHQGYNLDEKAAEAKTSIPFLWLKTDVNS